MIYNVYLNDHTGQVHDELLTVIDEPKDPINVGDEIYIMNRSYRVVRKVHTLADGRMYHNAVNSMQLIVQES